VIGSVPSPVPGLDEAPVEPVFSPALRSCKLIWLVGVASTPAHHVMPVPWVARSCTRSLGGGFGRLARVKGSADLGTGARGDSQTWVVSF